MCCFRFGTNAVEVHDGYTVTKLADGREVHARHDEQPGQSDLARDLGYASAEAMNRHHDLMHTLLCHWLGLPHSITLRAVADGMEFEHWREEEAAVLAIQSFANRVGIDLMRVARAHSDRRR